MRKRLVEGSLRAVVADVLHVVDFALLHDRLQNALPPLATRWLNLARELHDIAAQRYPNASAILEASGYASSTLHLDPELQSAARSLGAVHYLAIDRQRFTCATLP